MTPPKCALLIILFLHFAGTLLCPGYAQEKKALYRIIDVHEHLQNRQQAVKFIAAMTNNSIASIVLVGSPDQVLFEPQGNLTGFTGFEKNNTELLEISRTHPDKFHAFASFSPDDTAMLDKLKTFIEQGGRGLKLYNGHYWFYDFYQIPLDAPHMMAVFKWCEQNRVPVIFHANARYYWDQLRHILDTHPGLVVNLPHFCMSLIDLDRMATLFNSYPNVFSDISCGEGELAYTTLSYISKYWAIYREFILTYRERFLFGADMVVTRPVSGTMPSKKGVVKDEKYVSQVMACYRDMLEEPTYTGVLIERCLEAMGIKKTEQNSRFNGLALDSRTLAHIYEINPKRFLNLN